jgi:hypothetical protein
MLSEQNVNRFPIHGNSWIVNLWGVLSEQNVNRFLIHGNSWIVNLWGMLSQQNVNRFPIHGNSWIVNLWGMLSQQNVNRFPIHGNSWIVNLWSNMNNYFDEESQNTNKELHHSHHTALSGWKTFLHLWTCSNAVNNKLSYWSMNCAHSLCQWYSIIAVQLRVLPWSPWKFTLICEACYLNKMSIGSRSTEIHELLVCEACYLNKMSIGSRSTEIHESLICEACYLNKMSIGSQSTEIHESLICEATWITTSTKNPKTPTKNCTTHTIPPCLDAKPLTFMNMF